MKSEGSSYSIDDLQRDGKTAWTGVRNYRARNFMSQDMAVGDSVLFYHSNTEPIGIFGLARVASAAHPDETQFDDRGHYYEPRATREKPVWYCVDIAFEEKFAEAISLAEIKADPALEGMMLREKGARLSIQPVSPAHFMHIVQLAQSQ